MARFSFTLGLEILTAAVLFQWQCAPCEAVEGVVYVSSLNHPCPQSPGQQAPCTDLNGLNQQKSSYMKSNATFEFFPGKHNLDRPFIVYMSGDLRNVSFRKLSPDRAKEMELTPGPVDIHCMSSYFSFYDIVVLHIQGLGFHDCGTLSQPSEYNAALQFTSVHYLKVNDSRVYGSVGPSMSALDVFGMSTITNSVLKDNSGSAPHIYVTYNSSICYGNHTSFYIVNSEFRNGSGGSLSVLVDSTCSSDIDVELYNVTTLGSVSGGTAGGDIEILLSRTGVNSRAQITISQCHIQSSGCTGIYVAPWMKYDSGFTLTGAVGNVRIRDSVITGHKQGGMFLFSPITWVFMYELSIEDSQIIDNVLQSSEEDLRQGAGMSVLHGPDGEGISGLIALRNVWFERNVHISVPLGVRPSTVYVAYAHLTVVDCKFVGNNGTGIFAYASKVIMSGTLAFLRNSAYQGGALALYGSSELIVHNNTFVDFRSNHATHDGGAIYTDAGEQYEPLVQYVMSAEAPKCFLQFQAVYNLLDLLLLNITLSFTNNTAGSGGSALYGGMIDDCTVDPNGYVFGYELLNTSIIIFDDISHSPVSSDPRRVCVCSNGEPNCTLVFLSQVLYPGEEFSLSAAVVGQRFGIVSSSIYGNFLFENETASPAELGSFGQYSQATIPDGCTVVTYSVLSNVSQVVLTLSATDAAVVKYLNDETVEEAVAEYLYSGHISNELLSFPVYVNLTLQPCPLGFVKTETPSSCACNHHLVDAGLSCNISDQTVQRNGTVWVNASFHGDTSDGVIVHKNCPFGYCKSQDVRMNLNDSDAQCAFRRSGTLCGGCLPGLSLALGNSHCLECSNAYLALIILFIVAGIVLVFFIRLLNLTVATGTINGLIFYANVVHANGVIFFPPGETNTLTVFLSWVNLDWGIEVCFFDGLTQYVKMWLQFVFPVYTWILVFSIIWLSHRSSIVAKAFGDHSVPLLSTLFLLSYTKLLRTIIAVFSVTTLEHPDGSQTAVWAYDGNIKYLGALHAPLFVVALIFLLFLWAPYTALLLFGQCLLRMNLPYKVARQITRLKPVLDSYFGPFKDRHRYWVGALLVVRCGLFLIFAFNSTNDPSVNLLATSIAILVLIVYSSVVGQVYRLRYLSLLELSFLLNVMVLTLGTFYNQLAHGNQAALFYTTVSVAFLEFIVIIAAHLFMTYKYCRQGYRKEVPVSHNFSRESSTDSCRHVQYGSTDLTRVFSSELLFPSSRDARLREPLLESY